MVSKNPDTNFLTRFGRRTTIDEGVFHTYRREAPIFESIHDRHPLNADILVFIVPMGETMSTEKAASGRDVEREEDDLFGDLPVEVRGWVRYSRNPDKNHFEYWKKGSTHIVGAYERVVAKSLRDDEIRVAKHTYDQFNNLLNTRTLAEKSAEDTDRLWRTAKDRMEKYPATESFDSPPEMPTSVGMWDLVSESHEQNLGETVWERPFGEAEFIAEQTDMIAHYSHTERPHQIRYREPDTDPEIVVDGIPRTSAFEIAINSLRALTAPLSEMEAQHDALQSVKGIGPAKSRQFILLGIRVPTDLKTYLNEESSLVNHHHENAIEKLLTTTIREQFV